MIIVESFGRGGAPRAPPLAASRGWSPNAIMPVTAASQPQLAGEPRFNAPLSPHCLQRLF